MSLLRNSTLLASLALAAACATESPRDVAQDSAAADLPATPAPSVDAAAAMSERGLPSLRAGATLADANGALNGALSLPSGADPTGCSYAVWRDGPPGVRVMVENGHIVRLDVDSAGIKTAEGAQVGDAESAVKQLYGTRAAVTPHKYEDGNYLSVRDAKDTTFAFVFETNAGKVTRYRAGQRPQVEYVEGCS